MRGVSALVVVLAALRFADGADANARVSPAPKQDAALQRAAREGRLLARPAAAPLVAAPSGLHRMGERKRQALLFVPATYARKKPAPLLVVLHGAGSNPQQGLSLLQSLADEAGVILLAPYSRGATWDLIERAYGADVAVLDTLLAETFRRYAVDPARVAIGGFSDGASYALSLGVANGDLFTHVVAFSPGFMAPPQARGTPLIFVSHGTRDSVLPIDMCSRRIVPELRRGGYAVTYDEFDGAHTVPAAVAGRAMVFFTKDASARR